MCFTAKGDAEVEAEAVDVERRHPISKRIRYHLQHPRVRQVERIAGTGVVDAMPLIVGDQSIIAGIVEAAERQRWTKFATFRSVVVNDIENDLDAGGVQPANGDAHFVPRTVR